MFEENPTCYLNMRHDQNMIPVKVHGQVVYIWLNQEGQYYTGLD